MKISAQAGADSFQVSIERQNGHYALEVEGVRHRVDARKLEGDFYSILMDGRSYEVSIEPTREGYLVRHGAAEQRIVLSDPGRQGRQALASHEGSARIVSVMPGRVVRVLVTPDERVQAGQGLVVIEAMKMENEIAAPRAGCVRSVAVQANQTVEAGAELLVLE
jgi:biotin carboxyl carrier protein